MHVCSLSKYHLKKYRLCTWKHWSVCWNLHTNPAIKIKTDCCFQFLFGWMVGWLVVIKPGCFFFSSQNVVCTAFPSRVDLYTEAGLFLSPALWNMSSICHTTQTCLELWPLFFFPPPNSFPFQAIRPTVFCFFQGCCLIGWPRLWLKLWDRSPTCCVFHSVASLRWKVCCWSCWGILPLQWLQSSVYGAASRHLKLCIENKGLLETTQ